jgi:hypothetical protein
MRMMDDDFGHTRERERFVKYLGAWHETMFVILCYYKAMVWVII